MLVTQRYFTVPFPQPSCYVSSLLLQDGKPLAYGSMALTTTKKNYAQVEKELLAIAFGVEQFHQYTYGRKVVVDSDHKPLETIFGKPLVSALDGYKRCLRVSSITTSTFTTRRGLRCTWRTHAVATSPVMKYT